MIKELPSYIEAPVRTKLEMLITIVCKSLPESESPEIIFVSTSLGDGGVPNYPGIWIFTPKLAVEIRNPLNPNRIQHELVPFVKAVDWMRLSARKYEFEDVSEESQLQLEFTTKDGYSGELSASGQGCSDLMEIYRQRFLPHFLGTM